MTKREKFKKILIGLGRIALFPIIVIEIIVLALVIREVVLYVFYPINSPLSVSVTDFKKMNIKYLRWIDPCNGKSDITQREDFDMSVAITNPNSYETLYAQTYSSFKSDQRFVIDFGMVDGDLKIVKYYDGKEIGSTDLSLRNQQGKRMQGTATQINATLPSDLALSQWLCSGEISISKYSDTYHFDFGSAGIFNNYSAAKISLNIKNNDELVVTLLNPILEDNPDELIDKVEVYFIANGDSSFAIMGIEGNHLSVILPAISTYYDLEQKKQVLPLGNSIESFLAQGVTITSPQGSAQFGSYKKFDLYKSLVEDTRESLDVPKVPVRFSEGASGGLSISTNLQNNEIKFAGSAPVIEYRKQRFGVSRWDSMPGYIQTGLFGLLLGAAPVWWGFFRKRTIKNIDTNLISDFQPKKDSFICVLNSGYMIAGTLIKEPSFWSPYYVICDAHRKQISEKHWELETIPKINIKASRVEQYYFKGK